MSAQRKTMACNFVVTYSQLKCGNYLFINAIREENPKKIILEILILPDSYLRKRFRHMVSQPYC